MSSEKDKLIAKCQALGVRTVGCRSAADYRAALDAQAPGWRGLYTLPAIPEAPSEACELQQLPLELPRHSLVAP